MKTIVPCPHCGNYDGVEFVDLREIFGQVAVMCWHHCGMDFHVNGIWFMLNRELVGDEDE